MIAKISITAQIYNRLSDGDLLRSAEIVRKANRLRDLLAAIGVRTGKLPLEASVCSIIEIFQSVRSVDDLIYNREDHYCISNSSVFGIPGIIGSMCRSDPASGSDKANTTR